VNPLRMCRGYEGDAVVVLMRDRDIQHKFKPSAQHEKVAYQPYAEMRANGG
jgi:hypothetical protein